MATRPPHECRKPGCHVLTNTPYCEEHTRPRESTQKPRESTTDRGYGHSWQKRREAYLARAENVLCRRCTAAGIRGIRAELIHHKDGNPHNNDESNLEPLCNDCHERHHGRKRATWDENLDLD